MNAYGFASGDPVNFNDPMGLCGNPTASGLGSLQCVLEDAVGGAKSAVSGAWNSYLSWSNSGPKCGITCIAIGFSGGIEAAGGGAEANIAERIAGGHAFEKHGGDFEGLGIRDAKQMQGFVQGIMDNATGGNVRSLSRGRTGYWDPASGTVVIHDPNSSDLGTAFRPAGGRAYFDRIK